MREREEIDNQRAKGGMIEGKEGGKEVKKTKKEKKKERREEEGYQEKSDASLYL